MLDSVIHELVCDQDEPTAPYRIDMVRVEYISDEVSDRLGLRVIRTEVDLTVYSRRASHELL